MKNRTERVIRGYGKDIPPLLLHVEIYFNQLNCEAKVAKDFYAHYTQRGWCNRFGQPIKDWKMHAWEWLWYDH